MEALKPATYEDLLAVPDHLVAEILYGSLHTSPRPAPRHANVSSGLGALLHLPWQKGRGGPGGWWILDEPELHLGEHVVVPDLAGWRRDRLETLPETAWFATTPDWVCEVLSPSTMHLDRGTKLDVYAAAGIPWAWLVDPIGKLIEVYERTDAGWLRKAVATTETEAALPPFEAVPLDVAALWAD
jgi:Uma2 family endonuclease